MSAIVGTRRPTVSASAPRLATATATTTTGGRDLPEPGPADAEPLGVLLRRAGAAVRIGIPDAVWAVASVAAVKPARGGHSVELVEPEVARAEAGLLRTYLPDGVIERLRRSTGLAVAAADLVGMTVVVSVAVELHPRWGLSGRVLALGPGIEESLAKRALDATVARLRREGLFDRQRLLPAPRDVTRVTVVHPPAAAGWADIARELSRWTEIGLIAMRSIPVPFEGPGAAAGIAAAVSSAMTAVDGVRPDLVLLVRGGGAAASLGTLDDEALARAIATAPVPVVTGVGHRSDGKTLADMVSAHPVDTPSKALALIRDLMVARARTARADYGTVMAAASTTVAWAGPRLAVLERLATAETLRQVEAASQRLDRGWGTVRQTAEGTRGRLARIDDGLDRMAADVATASPLLVARTASELAALMETIRARARCAGEGADDGTRHLAVAAERAVSLVDTAGMELATLARAADTAAAARLDHAAAGLDVLARSVREHAQQHVTRADDGTAALDGIEAAVAGTLRAQDAVIARLRETIEVAVDRRFDAAMAALDRALITLDGAEPSRVLRLGYALVMDGEGRVITSVAAAQAASTLVLTFADGIIAVRPAQP